MGVSLVLSKVTRLPDSLAYIPARGGFERQNSTDEYGYWSGIHAGRVTVAVSNAESL